jgi:drug/metabolite transporter (DMT)-like permease
VVLVGLVFLRKKVHVAELLSVALCMVGVMLFYEPGADINLVGSAMALGSGVLFAIYIVMLDVFRWRQEVHGYLLSFYIAAFSALMTGLLCAVTGDFALPAGLGGWGLCLLFALLMTVLAMSMFQQAALLIGGEKTSVLSTLEPITSIVVGVLVFRERVGIGALLGSVLVIAASVLIALSDLKRAKAAR